MCSVASALMAFWSVRPSFNQYLFLFLCCITNVIGPNDCGIIICLLSHCLKWKCLSVNNIMAFSLWITCSVYWHVTARAAASTTRVVNYLSNFLLLEYSLISISGCKFPFPIAVFCRLQSNSIDELLEFMEQAVFARRLVAVAFADPPSLIRHWQLVLKYFWY